MDPKDQSTCDTYSRQSVELQPSADVENGFAMMQHLIDEMDKSSQRIDQFNIEEFGGRERSSQSEKHHIDLLYDEAWKSEDSDAASLKEVPTDFLERGHGHSGHEDAVTSAIAEVSKDFLAGLRASAVRAQSGDSDDSHLSSDTDFKLIKGMPAYARYPETAAGLSDNDWNPYGTESDTNISPRMNSQETPGGRSSVSKLSAVNSFNPPLHSTDLNAATPSSIIGSIPNTGARLQGIHEVSGIDSVASLKPDVTADFSTISHISEQTFGPQIALLEPARVSDMNKTMRGTELEGFGNCSKNVGIEKLQDELEEFKKSHQNPLDKDFGASTRSSEYKTIGGPYISVMDRAKMIGIPEDIVEGKSKNFDDFRKIYAYGSNNPYGYEVQESETGDVSEKDDLGKKVEEVLLNTRHLESSHKPKKTMSEVAIDYRTLQKDLQEIQDSLHNNFGSGTASTIVAKNDDIGFQSSAPSKSTPPSSDNDGEIIPSTTTTPDKKRSNRMAWDFAGDLASGQLGGHMEEVSLNTYGNSSNSQRPSTEKQSYNSDGDETRTSGSSDKVDDHAAADQALAEMSAILRPHPQLVMTAASASNGINSAQDIDQMLTNFRDQRRELECRYQQLSNPGLADKVFRILTSQDPEAQADGILSHVSAQEREERARYALNLHNDNNRLNFSSTDTDNPSTTNQSFSLPDDVRKRLDLSGLSSADGSKLADKSSFVVPSSKGFAAFDDMTKFLSSQMAKASERTFNHSLEMQLPPQVATCYPLFADYKQEKEPEEKTEGNTKGVSTSDRQLVDILSGTPVDEHPTATSSPIEAFTGCQNESSKQHSSPEDSDSSSGKRKEKYRPYRPTGSKDFYYTESDAASVADSVTTIESTHIGSDDARGPVLPSSALGSRKDPPNTGGIYAKHKPLGLVQEGGTLPPIQEKSISDDRDSEQNFSSKGSADSETKAKEVSYGSKDQILGGRHSLHAKQSVDEAGDDGIRVHSSMPPPSAGESLYTSRGVAAARRDAQWENRVRERGQDYLASSRPATEGIREPDAKFQELSDFSRSGPHSQHPAFEERQSEDTRGSYRLTPDGFVPSEQLSSKDYKQDEPVSLRVKMTYTDKPGEKRERYQEESAQRHMAERSERYPNEGGARYELETEDQIPEPRFLSTKLLRQREYQPVLSSYVDRDRGSSPINRDYDGPADTAHRATYEDQDSPARPGRDARLSPAFHRALSADLRHAIEARSPLLSQNIERSLAQAPLEGPARRLHHSDKDQNLPRRSSSPPPTFLARERGQPPRDYARSPVGRRSPPPGSKREQAWAEYRPVSPTQDVRRRSSHSAERSRPRSPGSSTERSRARSPGHSPKIHQMPSTSPSSLARDHPPRAVSPTQEKRYSSPSHKQRSWSPVLDSQKFRSSNSGQRHVERTLENMTSESEDTEIDREPLSRRAQMLTAALPHEDGISPDINTLWDRFKALNESHDSSMNSSRIEAVTDLLRNPSQHLIAQYLKEREEYRIERQERVEAERERRLKEQQMQPAGNTSHFHSSSEDDFHGGYTEMLVKKEEERMKRRTAKKKKWKPGESGRSRSAADGEKNKENVPDCLFSIPEDAGSEHSPSKGLSSAGKGQKSRQLSRQEQHVIDPNMQKLREKISRQRGKIDKQTLKELQRVEKLRKLEQLLSAKRSGQISDRTLEKQLEEVSTTSTPGSNSSHDIDDADNGCNTPLSEDSTTAKDSSAEMHAWKAEKERRVRETQLAETERRKEFRSRDRVDVREVNRNTNRMVSAHPRAKEEEDISELKLLRMVREGYLSPEEAYRIAVKRAQENKLDADSSSASHSSLEDHSFSGRRHHLYSPYSRQDEFQGVRSRHMPKLKQLSSATSGHSSPTHSSSRVRHQPKWSKESYQPATSSVALPEPSRSPERQHSLTGNGKTYRPSSRSPGSRQARPVSQSLKASSPSRVGKRQGNPFFKLSASPQRSQRLHHHHHHQHQRLRGERYPTQQDPRLYKPDQGMPAPTPKGVSWQISMDVHPSKWEAPAGPESKSQTKTRQQLPLPEPPTDMEEGEEPLQSWEKQSRGPLVDGFWHTSAHPQGIPQELWEEVVSQDALASKANHWEVDPLMDKVQYILNKESPVVAEEAVPGMTLQDAFLARKQIFISKCRERQKRIVLARENRHLQECLRLQREAIFADQDRLLPPNLHAHPVSENLYQPKRRVISKTEMKALTQRRYKKLHEVVQKEEKQKTEAEHKLNRLRVQIFNRKVQRGVLKKTSMRRR